MPIEKYQPTQEEIQRAEEMMTNEQKGSSLKREKFTQGLEHVIERYPDLDENIQISLETPQLGEHHNEGPKMDSHLSLMLETLGAISEGRFHEALADQKEIQKMMSDSAVTPDPENPERTRINPVLVEYTFLHDISKPDCLTIKIEGEKKGVEITREQWQKIGQSGRPYQFEGKSITSISYYHPSEGATGQHGNKAAEMLKDHNVPPEILIAISKHEVAYQFARINAATYEEHFVKPGFTEDQQRFILIASYIDTMASLLPDGKVDLGNFINLLNSRNNYSLIKEYMDQGIKFRENDLAVLKKQDQVLTREDIEKKIQREEKYNPSLLGEKLDTIIAEGKLAPEDKEMILSTLSTQPNELGRRLGSKMRFVKPLLEQSRE